MKSNPNQSHQLLRASLALLCLALLTVGIWATVFLVLTTKINLALILVLGGGWVALFLYCLRHRHSLAAHSTASTSGSCCSSFAVAAWHYHGNHRHHQSDVCGRLGQVRRRSRINLYRSVPQCHAICLLCSGKCLADNVKITKVSTLIN